MKIEITREIKIAMLNALKAKEINDNVPDQKPLIEAIRKIKSMGTVTIFKLPDNERD